MMKREAGRKGKVQKSMMLRNHGALDSGDPKSRRTSGHGLRSTKSTLNLHKLRLNLPKPLLRCEQPSL